MVKIVSGKALYQDHFSSMNSNFKHNFAMPWPIFTNYHLLQTRKLKLSIRVRGNSIAFQTIEIRRSIHVEVVVDPASSVCDMHHFERPYLKTALIDVMALFAWAGSYGHWPWWICRYFRGSRRAGKFKTDISRLGGDFPPRREISETGISPLLFQGCLLIWAIRGAWENYVPTFTVGMHHRGPGLGLRPWLDPVVHPASECRKLYWIPLIRSWLGTRTVQK